MDMDRKGSRWVEGGMESLIPNRLNSQDRYIAKSRQRDPRQASAHPRIKKFNAGHCLGPQSKGVWQTIDGNQQAILSSSRYLSRRPMAPVLHTRSKDEGHNWRRHLPMRSRRRSVGQRRAPAFLHCRPSRPYHSRRWPYNSRLLACCQAHCNLSASSLGWSGQPGHCVLSYQPRLYIRARESECRSTIAPWPWQHYGLGNVDSEAGVIAMLTAIANGRKNNTLRQLPTPQETEIGNDDADDGDESGDVDEDEEDPEHEMELEKALEQGLLEPKSPTHRLKRRRLDSKSTGAWETVRDRSGEK